MTTPTTPRIGRVPADLLPTTKAVLGPVVLDLLWILADGFDWEKVGFGLLAVAANWLAPDWTPPRATAAKVLAAVRPGDQVGPVAAGGRRFVVVEPGPSNIGETS